MILLVCLERARLTETFLEDKADSIFFSAQESLVLGAEAWWRWTVIELDGIFGIKPEKPGDARHTNGESNGKSSCLLVTHVLKCIDAEIATRSHCMIWAGMAYTGVMTVWHLL
jgi:hypothetical protein